TGYFIANESAATLNGRHAGGEPFSQARHSNSGGRPRADCPGGRGFAGHDQSRGDSSTVESRRLPDQSVVFVAQTASLSESPEIVAAREDFSERGCVRST